jgi:hypothetical protein
MIPGDMPTVGARSSDSRRRQKSMHTTAGHQADTTFARQVDVSESEASEQCTGGPLRNGWTDG